MTALPYMPAVAGATIVAGGVALYKALRPHFQVTVNCWFCGEDSKVPYGNINCWDCPKCEQYNGFTSDGDYNKPIPSQFSEDLNHAVSSSSRSPTPGNSPIAPKNLLCELCNRNQILKVRQLADFIPENEALYDQEVERYKDYLEHVYGLCQFCEHKKNREIEKQNQVLYKKLERLQTPLVPDSTARNGSPPPSPFSSFNQSHRVSRLFTPWHIVLMRVVPVVCSLNLAVGCTQALLEDSPAGLDPEVFLSTSALTHIQSLYQFCGPITAAALFVSILSVYMSGKESLSGYDALSIFAWLLLLMLHSPVGGLLAGPGDRRLLQATVSILCLFLTLTCLVMPRYARTSNKRFIKSPLRRQQHNTSGISSSSPSVNNSPTPSVTEEESHSQSQSQTDDRIHLDRLETMSIGTPSKRRGDRLRAFGEFGNMASMSGPSYSPPKPFSVDPMSGLRHSRPVISPARFRPSAFNMGARQTSFNPAPARMGLNFGASTSRPQTQFGLFGSTTTVPSRPGWTSLAHASTQQQHAFGMRPMISQGGGGIPDDRASLFSEPRAPTADGTSSSSSSSQSQSSSQCPVDSTTQRDTDVTQPQGSGRGSKSSITSQVVWGLSIGLNMALVVCVLVYSSWLDWITDNVVGVVRTMIPQEQVQV